MSGAKIRLVVDGRECLARAGENLLGALREAGFAVPGLCWHRKLSPTGACRLCLVKVEGRRGLAASCALTAADGMVVTAFDAELEAHRRAIVDLLLAEHRGAEEPGLRDELLELAARYGLADPAARRVPPLHARMTFPTDGTSPVLFHDAGRCIKCFRCVKACDEVQGKGVLSMQGRGLASYIVAGAAPGRWGASECDGCGECAQLCPTGAILETQHREALRAGPPERRVRTTCPYCGVGCQIELWVKGNRIVRSRGVERPPNDGRLCVKGRFGYDFVASPDRLTTPLLREGERFRPIPWDEALDLAAARFAAVRTAHGPDALAGYASAKCTNEENYLFQKLVRVAFGTNNVDYCTRLCHASTVTAMIRSIGDGAASNPVEDYERADFILVTGNNMVETHPVTATYVKRAKAAGARLVVIDPRWTPLARHADLWLKPRLGTDVALLNGMIRHAIASGLVDRSFVETRVEGGLAALEELSRIVAPYTPERVREITGCPPEAVATATGWYAAARRALLATGMGMSQQTVGTANCFALLDLCLILGKIGREGCGVNPPRGQNNVQGATDVGCVPGFYPGYIPAADAANRARVAAIWGVPPERLSDRPGLTTVEIAQAAHERRVRALYVMGENPMLSDPHLSHVAEALDRLDFLVVQDLFMTETARRAHLVLPACAFAEKEGTAVSSDRRVLRVRKAVEAPGEARDDGWILREVARRMGSPIGDYASAREIFAEIARAAPLFGGIDYDRLEREDLAWPCPEKGHPGTPTLYLDRFNTPSGRARLHPVAYEPQAEPACDRYPLILNTGRILYQYHTATMSRRSRLTAFADDAYCLMHPEDAAALGLSDRGRVRIASRRGAIETTLRVSAEVKPGELFMPFHFAEAPVNALTRDTLDPFSKIAPFKYTAVRVERAQEADRGA